jgi:hypothetical protein
MAGGFHRRVISAEKERLSANKENVTVQDLWTCSKMKRDRKKCISKLTDVQYLTLHQSICGGQRTMPGQRRQRGECLAIWDRLHSACPPPRRRGSHGGVTGGEMGPAEGRVLCRVSVSSGMLIHKIQRVNIED